MKPGLLFVLFLLENHSCSIVRNTETHLDDKCSESSYLWRIDTSPPSYFFGTIHVPYTKVWNKIPESVLNALQESEKVYLELDMRNPSTIAEFAECQLLPNGTTLSQILPPDLFSRLQSHLAWVEKHISGWMTKEQVALGLTPEILYNVLTANWERKRPIWAMLLVQSLTANDVASIGLPILDIYLAQIAEQQNKQLADLETVSDQCLPWNSLSTDQSVFALAQILEEVSKNQVLPAKERLINSYRCGNLSPEENIITGTEHLNDEERKIVSEIELHLSENFLYRRNRKMGNRVVELLARKSGTSYFFALGARHFIGENSILDVVRKAGFTVEKIQSQAKNFGFLNFMFENFMENF